MYFFMSVSKDKNSEEHKITTETSKEYPEPWSIAGACAGAKSDAGAGAKSCAAAMAERTAMTQSIAQVNVAPSPIADIFAKESENRIFCREKARRTERVVAVIWRGGEDRYL
ncbi:unnamed protein product [Ilex paraguariensis]|uniref:Uncharacterized protein n=1 Tax=Ilex paraguariensis TaxID=185542 RepID=A0ABC8SCE3_9AQUA